MKFVVLIIDGAAGWPAADLGGKTSLEAAHLPLLDRLAAEGQVGLVRTVPDGMEPSSAVACMSVLGFDPALYYAGRGPIEALSLGIDLEPGEAALRCNFVTIQDGRMASYAAGNISSAEARELVAALNNELGDGRIAFHHGVGFRSILTVREGRELVETACVPPHDIADRPVEPHLPQGPGAELLREIMERSREILARHPVNAERAAQGESPATQVWLFWPGLQAVPMPAFSALYGRRAGLTSAVDLLKGLARQAAIEFLPIPGVTDGGDNDYGAQMAGALEALREREVVFVHVEAPDEAGHRGDAAAKVRALEQVDALMLPQVAERGDLRVLVLPDHPTPLTLKTHVAEPVPYLLWGPGFSASRAAGYTEGSAAAAGKLEDPGHGLVGRLFGEV